MSKRTNSQNTIFLESCYTFEKVFGPPIRVCRNTKTSVVKQQDELRSPVNDDTVEQSCFPRKRFSRRKHRFFEEGAGARDGNQIVDRVSGM